MVDDVSRRLVSIAVLAVLALSLTAPLAAATHAGGYRTQDYVAGSRAGELIGDDRVPLCDVPLTHLSVGGVCFDLDDQEHQIDISVEDRGRRAVAQGYRSVENTAPVDVPDRLPGDAPAELPEEVRNGEPDGYYVSGTIRYIDDGTISLSYDFCAGAYDRMVPAYVDAIEVVFDGPTEALADCGPGYTGAATGTVFLQVKW